MIAAVCSVTAWLMADTVSWGSGGWGASASNVEWVPGAGSCLVAAMTSRTTFGTAAAISSVTIPVTLACRASSVSEGRGSSSPLATWPELRSEEDAPLPCGRGWDQSSRSNDWPELSPGHLFFAGSGVCEQSLSSESSANLWGFRRILTPPRGRCSLLLGFSHVSCLLKWLSFMIRKKKSNQLLWPVCYCCAYLLWYY